MTNTGVSSMNFQWLFDRPIAHRGLHDEQYPENSMPAYEQAIAHNFNIEIDVHVSKDGEVVVFHDDNLKRVCGVDKLVKDCTVKELKSYPLANSEYVIPTFKEFLALVDGKVGILCEIKGINPFDHRIARETIKVLDEVGYKGNIALQSFDFGAVLYAKRHSNYACGELCTWCSPDGKHNRWWATDFMGKLWINKITRPDFIAYDVRAVDRNLPENKWIVKWSKKLPILMWTIKSQETLENATKYANNVIFEHMDAALMDSLARKFMPFRCLEKNLPSNK